MESSSDNSRKITVTEEICDILQAALTHGWNFSYLAMVNHHLSSHCSELVDVNPELVTLSVAGDALYEAATTATDGIVFRAQNGGILIVFTSTLLPLEKNQVSNSDSRVCLFEFPASLRFSQLRKAIRISYSKQQNIPVTFFASLGVRFQGSVVDISAIGAKIRFDGNISDLLESSEIIADCQIRLPDESLLEARARVLGHLYDSEQDISYLRCQYLDLNMNSELQLKNLIDDALRQMDQSDLSLGAL
ncbi:MAG TPA: PilZ domain-containing protein [Gammaproteobacteria bacterium]|nr:PilZ domain-containing protein [Gammaproteobacteria bacterium]